MSAAAVYIMTLSLTTGDKASSSADLEPIFKSISVSSDGTDHGTTLTESGGKFDHNGKVLANIGAGTSAGEALSYTQRGAANGVASLDGSGKIPSAQLTAEVFEYKGAYNATTNSPSLANGAGSTGDVYRVTTAGTQDFGAGNITFALNDKVVYNGSVWEKWDVTEAISSVNGFTGVVVLSTSDVAEGSNLYYTSARFNTAFAAKSTTDLSEGTNLYFTTARARTAAVVDSLAGSQTDQAPSVSAVNTALSMIATNTIDLENATGGAITQRQFTFQDAFGTVQLLAPDAAALTQWSLLTAVFDATIADTDTGTFYKSGATIMGFPSSTFTVNMPIYPSKTTPGDVQQDLTGYESGDHVVELGFAESDTAMLFQPTYKYQLTFDVP